MAKIILGKVLKRKRISKYQFAKMLGVSYPNVFRLFRPTSNPKFATLVKWAKILKIKVRDLIEE